MSKMKVYLVMTMPIVRMMSNQEQDEQEDENNDTNVATEDSSAYSDDSEDPNY